MDAEQGGALCGNNLITGESVRIDYTFNEDYVLTYARNKTIGAADIFVHSSYCLYSINFFNAAATPSSSFDSVT